MVAERVDKWMAGITGKGCLDTCLLMDGRMLSKRRGFRQLRCRLRNHRRILWMDMGDDDQ